MNPLLEDFRVQKKSPKDVPPDVLAEIISRAASRINKRNAPRLFSQYRTARAQQKVLNDLKVLENKLKQSPDNLEARREYAELLAVSGDWKAALEQFSKLKGKEAKMAKAELDGKAKPGTYQFHKVKISRDFYMATHLGTIKQWREFMKRENPWNEREKREKLPGRMDSLAGDRAPASGSYVDVMALICKLNYEYGDRLPKGYVFRLPTEAEWEYACKANSPKNDPYMKMKWTDSELKKITVPFEARKTMLKNKCGWTADSLAVLDENPWWVPAPAVGTSKPNAWGLYDMIGVKFQFTLDTVSDTKKWPQQLMSSLSYDAMGCSEDPLAVKYGLDFDKGERLSVVACGCGYLGVPVRNVEDPLFKAKFMCHGDAAPLSETGFRIVIGPDLLDERKLKYPDSDFGGKLVSEMCRIDEITREWTAVDAYKWTLFNPFNRYKAGYFMAFHTHKCKNPHIQIKLPEEMKITGLIVENRYEKHQDIAVPLVIWVSNGKKTWTPVCEDEKIRAVYRFDLSKKNVRGSYLRFGRKPGAKNVGFHLAKILVYAK